MMQTKRWLMCAICVALLGWTAGSATGKTTWTMVYGMPGMEYRPFSGPVHVARMLCTSLTYIETGYPMMGIHPQLTPGGAPAPTLTTRSQAYNFDGAISTRDGGGYPIKVGVAINGSPFQYQQLTNNLLGGFVHQGWFARPFPDGIFGGTGSGGFRFSYPYASYHTDGDLNHPAPNQVVANLDKNIDAVITGLNRPAESMDLIAYTPQYGTNTFTGENTYEVVIQMDAPAGPNKTTTGTVRFVHATGGNSPIGYDQIVLAAKGTAATSFLEDFEEGDEVTIQFTTGGSGAQPNWDRAYSSLSTMAIGCGQLPEGLLVSNGVSVACGTTNDKRTAVAYGLVDGYPYVYFIVAPSASFTSLANFCVNTLGVTWAVNMDGGGSSTMVKRSGPSSFEMVYPSNILDQRSVSTTLMMCHREVKHTSTAGWAEGRILQFTGGLMIGKYRGPGKNYYVDEGYWAGATYVKVVDNPLNGVLASTGTGTSDYWWKIKRLDNGQESWLPQNVLAAAPGVLVDNEDPGFGEGGCDMPGMHCNVVTGGCVWDGSAVTHTWDWFNNNSGGWSTNALPGNGYYKVEAYICPDYTINPPGYSDTLTQYNINDNGPGEDGWVNIYQAHESGWTDLGTYYLYGAPIVNHVAAYGRNTGGIAPRNPVLYLDAVRWTKVGE